MIEMSPCGHLFWRRLITAVGIAGAWLSPGGAAAEPAVIACDVIRQAEFHYEVARVTAEDVSTAVSKARTKAEADLLDRECAGLDDALCRGIQAQISHFHHEDDGVSSACAVVAVRADVRQDLDRQVDQLEADVGVLARRIAENHPGRVVFEDPIWKNKCDAGQLGDYLWTALSGRLGSHSSSIRLEDERTNEIGVLQLRLSVVSSDVEVMALLQAAGEKGSKPIEGPRFKGALFGLSGGEMPQCQEDNPFGLVSETQAGAGNLRVGLEVPERRDFYCESDIVEPVVSVTEPAKVQVFGVRSDGLATLIWPFPGDAGIVEDSTAIGRLYMSLPERGMAEWLVVLAVPLDRTFSRSEGWAAYCESGEAFSGLFLPPGTAAARIQFEVRAQGTGTCPPRDVDTGGSVPPCAPN